MLPSLRLRGSGAHCRAIVQCVLVCGVDVLPMWWWLVSTLQVCLCGTGAFARDFVGGVGVDVLRMWLWLVCTCECRAQRALFCYERRPSIYSTPRNSVDLADGGRASLDVLRSARPNAVVVVIVPGIAGQRSSFAVDESRKATDPPLF